MPFQSPSAGSLHGSACTCKQAETRYKVSSALACVASTATQERTAALGDGASSGCAPFVPRCFLWLRVSTDSTTFLSTFALTLSSGMSSASLSAREHKKGRQQAQIASVARPTHLTASVTAFESLLHPHPTPAEPCRFRREWSSGSSPVRRVKRQTGAGQWTPTPCRASLALSDLTDCAVVTSNTNVMR